MSVIGICCFILSWLTLYLIFFIKSNSGRKAFCFSSTTWLFVLFSITEMLSLFHAVNRHGISACWIVVELTEIVIFFVLKGKTKHTNPFRSVKGIIEGIKDDDCSIVLFGIIVILLLRSSWLAVNTVPYNWDSMTYHLSRIMFWIKHQNVSYYETNIIRQLVSPVLAEYVNLHVFLLTGTDKFANLLQNVSLYGCTFLVISIIGEFVNERKWIFIGGILLITMNAVYAESTTTQVDLFAAFLLLNFAYQIILICKVDHIVLTAKTVFTFVVVGISAGLLYITKGNAAIPAAYITIIAILFRLIRKDKPTQLLVLGMAACFTAVLIAFPTFYRNYNLTGDILASNYIGGITIGTISPRYLIVNAVKNYTNVAVGHQNKECLKNMTNWIGSALKVDINSTDISFGNKAYNIGYSTHMDCAGAHLLAPLLLITSIVGIIRLMLIRNKTELLVFSLLCQFYLSIMAIRWQPWVVRLLIPSLCLTVPAIIFYLEALFHSGKKASYNWLTPTINVLRCFLMALIVFTCISNNYDEYSYLHDIALKNIKTSQPRFELYFLGRGNGAYYVQMCDTIDAVQSTETGLFTGSNSYQYPLLAKYYGQKRFENVTLNKEVSDSKMNAFFHPEIIVVTDLQLDTNEHYYCNGIQYSCINDFGSGYSLWAVSPQ